MWYRFCSVFVFFLALHGCASNPATGDLNFVTVSEQDEIQLGLDAKAEFVKNQGAYYDADLIHYVNKIGQNIANSSDRAYLKHSFTILDTPTVNAYALYGGHIFVTRGLLAELNSSAQLAAFLSHELAHVSARHGVQNLTKADIAKSGRIAFFHVLAFTEGAKRLTKRISNPFYHRYSQKHELQADYLATRYLTKSGYAPKYAIEMLNILKNREQYMHARYTHAGLIEHDFERDNTLHPDIEQRILQLQNKKFTHSALENNKADNKTNGKTNSKVAKHDALYYRLINNIDYGYNEKYGIAHENYIYYKAQNLKISLPPNWQIIQRGYTYYASNNTNGDYIKLTLLLPTKATVEQAIALSINKNSAQPFANGGSVLRREVNSLKGKQQADLVLLPYQSVLLSLVAIGNDTQRLRDTMRELQNSLSPIPEAEQPLAKTRKIKVIQATASDSYRTLAQDSILGTHAEGELRLLNQATEDDDIVPGQWIKIVQ